MMYCGLIWVCNHWLQAILPIALGFAGGCMIWIVFAELLPDAFNAAPPKQVRCQACHSNVALLVGRFIVQHGAFAWMSSVKIAVLFG